MRGFLPECDTVTLLRPLPLQNLMQFPDRHKWYEAKFAAEDMPDWNPGRFVSIDQEAPGGWEALRYFAPPCVVCSNAVLEVC
jgi:hypothetical protein